MDAEHIHKQGQQLFSKRGSLLTLWQEIALNFYPERADFTSVRNLGDELATNLTSSYPIITRRELGNTFSSMLRPSAKQWHHMRTNNYDSIDNDGRAWLEWANGRLSQLLRDKRSQFQRATKEGDHDYAAFGQCVIQHTLNKDANGLLFRCWHLRDVAWCENVEGVVDTVYREWKPTYRQMIGLFGDCCHQKIKDKVKESPYQECKVWHCVVPSDQYDIGKPNNAKFVSIYYDVEHGHVMEAVPSHTLQYTIPRWQTVSGSQYAYSPATVCALPDARLLQSITLSLLEAGEKAANPPMIATEEMVRSDVSLFAGGITWVDAEYDERMGEVLRPISQDISGFGHGIELLDRTRQALIEAFYLNKIGLQPANSGTTAYEISQRVQEYIRQALPLFEPVEVDYNGSICESSFEIAMRAGFFGSPLDIPKSIRGAEISFMFESPLHDAIEKQKSQTWMEAKAIIADAVGIDQSCIYMVDAKKALRDTLQGIGVPAKWMRSEGDVDEAILRDAEAAQQQQMLDSMQQGANIANTLTDVQNKSVEQPTI